MERDAVSSAVYDNVNPWFSNEGITLNRVSLKDWDFTNKDVGKAFDETIVAQTLQAQAQAKYDAAIVERKQQLYIAETQGLVMKQLAQDQYEAMRKLGVISEDSVIRWLTIQWLKNLDKTPNNVIVNTGGNAVPVTVGTQP
jgi:hypothetical protein